MAVTTYSDTLAELWVGATGTGTVSFDTYPATTHTCTYHFRTLTERFNVSGTASGSNFTVTIPDTQSAKLSPGQLAFVAYVEDTAGTVNVADQGFIPLYPDPSKETTSERVLAAIRARIEGRANDDQLTIRIADMELKYLTPDQLREWEAYYAGRVRSEMDNLRKATGNGSAFRVMTRFNRVG